MSCSDQITASDISSSSLPFDAPPGCVVSLRHPPQGGPARRVGGGSWAAERFASTAPDLLEFFRSRLELGGGFQRVMNNQLLDEGAPQALRFMGVWNCLMLSSVSLQTALLVSAWTFYRTYRALGLYPPEPRKGHVHPDVSPFEFVCEAEDVALLSDQCHGNWSCERGPGGLAAQEATVTPGPPPRRVLHEDDVHYSLEEVRPSK
ncbi:unnamed protein product [Durusdinium trenchii]|uniref:Uncharacterized protein n=1 Tax=Durusdinium trenchii TaxID=1381693 RepID=A0ABP0QDI2_9DINO